MLFLLLRIAYKFRMGKRKIALLTMHQVKNYGSVLQTLATQTIFESYNYDVEVIDYRRNWETPWGYWFCIPEKNIKDVLRQLMYFPSKVIQYFVFRKFLRQYIKLTHKVYTCSDDFKKYPVQADVFCTGSDQVWNSGWNHGVIEEYYLSFTDSPNKIAYAASIGNIEIDNNEIEKIRPYLKKYKYITVREKSAVELINSMIEGEARLVLDPTLQLSRIDWEKLIDCRKRKEANYVLLIQLNRNHEFDDFAVEFAKRHNKKLLRLCLRVDQMILPGKPVIIPKVENYVNLIKYADFVLTDSFHAVSFSLNFNKQFLCVLPSTYSTRLKSILDLTMLTSRIVDNYEVYDYMQIDYEKVNPIIDSARQNSTKYINYMLNEINY